MTHKSVSEYISNNHYKIEVFTSKEAHQLGLRCLLQASQGTRLEPHSFHCHILSDIAHQACKWRFGNEQFGCLVRRPWFRFC